MRAFAELYEALDGTNSTNEKIHLMGQFFKAQDRETIAWSLFFLSGQKNKQTVGSAKLRRWAQEETKLPDWILEECYSAVGDTAEMVSLILAVRKNNRDPELDRLTLGEWMHQEVIALNGLSELEQKERVLRLWSHLGKTEIFLLNKFLTGALRVGVNETLVYRALSEATGLPRTTIASRMIGRWQPSAAFVEKLFHADSGVHEEEGATLPKPFCLAAPLEDDPQSLGSVEDWQLEWKWDGIRCQVVKRGSQVDVWSRGEERITGSFPDLAAHFIQVPGDFTLDGELIAGDPRMPALFNELQKRLNKKKPSAKFLAENPIGYLAYDLLHLGKDDLLQSPLAERRMKMETLLAPFVGQWLAYSEVLTPQSWEEAAKIRQGSRERGAEGLMLKKLDSIYATGRKRGIWFKWKVDPLTVDAVLTAAQPGTGRRASLYTDYTFSIWKDKTLVPIAKAYSGLTDAEIRSLDAWVRHHTLDRFGPVRMLEPLRVFELGFEGMAESSRHKSGYALRFPRILRERTDKPVSEANRVEDMAALLSYLRGNQHPTEPEQLAMGATQ